MVFDAQTARGLLCALKMWVKKINFKSLKLYDQINLERQLLYLQLIENNVNCYLQSVLQINIHRLLKFTVRVKRFVEFMAERFIWYSCLKVACKGHVEASLRHCIIERSKKKQKKKTCLALEIIFFYTKSMPMKWIHTHAHSMPILAVKWSFFYASKILICDTKLH